MKFIKNSNIGIVLLVAASVLLNCCLGSYDIDLFVLSTESGSFTLTGAEENDYTGVSVASAGDFNGDGYGDIIIGANGASRAADFAGLAYVVFGKETSVNIDLSDFTSGENGFLILGAAINDHLGTKVSGAGDVNGDGIDDVIIGAPTGGITSNGTAYVVYG